MNKEILIITHEYPQKYGDTAFLENEINCLTRYFSKIHIIYLNTVNQQYVSIPSNVTVNCFHYKKKYVLYMLECFSKFFWKEVKYILENRKQYRAIILALRFGVVAKTFSTFLKNYFLKNPKIELVYTYWNSYEILSALLLKKIYPNLKVVSRIHRYDLYEERNNYLYQPYKKYIAKNVDHIFFISKNGYEYFIKKWNDSFYDRKFSVCYLGTSPNKSIKLSKTENIFSILTCSYIVPVKRLDKLIEGLSLIENVSIRWTHIGNGSLEIKIKAYAKEKLSHKKNIQFEFLGFMPNEEVRKHLGLNYYDLFVNVSASEGIPVSIMEAMSVGIPIIATDVGGVSEIVNEANGYLLPVDFMEKELAQLIVLYSEKTLSEQEKYRENAYKTWESCFNAETNYNKLSKVLLDLME